MTAHTNALNVFLSTLNAGRLRRMESRLGKVLAEARLGRRDLSAILRQGDHNSQLADQQWKILEDELAESGFSRSDIASHRHWFENLAQVSFVAGTDAPDNASLSTNATAELPDEAKTKSTPQRLYKVRRDCVAQNDGSLKVRRDDVVECTSNLAVNVLDLDPKFMCSFKHIPSNKIVLLRVSDVQKSIDCQRDSLYSSPSAFTAMNAKSSSLTPSPQGSGPSALAAKPSEQIPSKLTHKSSSTSTNLRDRIWGESPRPAPRPPRVSTPQRIQTGPPLSVNEYFQTSRMHSSRRVSATASRKSRSSSPARSIRTEASEYDSNGRLVRSKTVTMTYGSEFFSRPRSALSEPDHIKTHRRTKYERRFSLAAGQQAEADRGRQDLCASLTAISALQSDQTEKHSREKHNPRFSFLARHFEGLFTRKRSTVPVNHKRQDAHTSPIAASTRQQSTADINHKRQDPQASFVAKSARSTAESVQLSQMPQSSLITLYEKRTQQLRNVMEILRNHKVIAADPFDYPVQSIDSMNKEMNILDIEIAAAMRRRR